MYPHEKFVVAIEESDGAIVPGVNAVVLLVHGGDNAVSEPRREGAFLVALVKAVYTLLSMGDRVLEKTL
eukprot:5450818-Prymnesium_polylepis.1